MRSQPRPRRRASNTPWRRIALCWSIRRRCAWSMSFRSKAEIELSVAGGNDHCEDTLRCARLQVFESRRQLFSALRVVFRRAGIKRRRRMKLLVIAVTSAVVLGTSAVAQNSQNLQPRVPDPEAQSGQPTVGPLQTTDPRTTTGQAPVAVPGQGSPYGARGGAIPGVPNPDRAAP